MKSSTLRQIPSPDRNMKDIFEPLPVRELTKWGYDSRDAPCPIDTQIGSDLQMLGGSFCDANLRHVCAEVKRCKYAAQTACEKKIWNKKKKKKSLLREPASHSPVMRHFCSQRGERCRSSYKKEIRGSGMFRFNEQTFRPGICAAASLVWHDEQGLSSIGSSPDPGSSCQSMHKSSPPPPSLLLLLLSTCNKQIHNALLKTDANTLTHASIPTRHKQNQADLCLSAEQLHSHARTPAIHAMMPLPWEGLLRHPQPAFLTDSYKKIKKKDPLQNHENQEIFSQATLHSFCFPQTRG